MATEHDLSSITFTFIIQCLMFPQLLHNYFSKIDTNFKKSPSFLYHICFLVFHIEIFCYFWHFFAHLYSFWEPYSTNYIYLMFNQSHFRSIYSCFINIVLYIFAEFNLLSVSLKPMKLQEYATWRLQIGSIYPSNRLPKPLWLSYQLCGTILALHCE